MSKKAKKKLQNQVVTLEKPEAPVVSEQYVSDTIAAMRGSAIAKASSADVLTIPVDEFLASAVDDWNPGRRKAGDEIILAEDIRVSGIHTPPWVAAAVELDGKSRPLLLRGYLRKMAILEIKKNHPDDFDRLFGGGVLVNKISMPLTDTEARYLAQDHGLSKSRSHMSVVDEGIELSRAGCTPKDICLKLYEEFEAVFTSISVPTQRKIAECKTTADKIAEMLKARRGVTQKIVRLAQKVSDPVYEAYKNGVEDGTNDDLPRIKDADLTAIASKNEPSISRQDMTPEALEHFELCKSVYGAKVAKHNQPLTILQGDEKGKQYSSKILRGMWHMLHRGAELNLCPVDARLRKMEEDNSFEDVKGFGGLVMMVKQLDEQLREEKAKETKKK